MWYWRVVFDVMQGCILWCNFGVQCNVCVLEIGDYVGGIIMNDYVYKFIEFIGILVIFIEDVVNIVIVCVNKMFKGFFWFQVMEMCGNIENGKVLYWQVMFKVGFCLEG